MQTVVVGEFVCVCVCVCCVVVMCVHTTATKDLFQPILFCTM